MMTAVDGMHGGLNALAETLQVSPSPPCLVIIYITYKDYVWVCVGIRSFDISIECSLMDIALVCSPIIGRGVFLLI